MKPEEQNPRPEAMLLVAHGSRRVAANREIARLAARLEQAATGRFVAVRHAFLELAEPNLLQGAGACVDAGAAGLAIVPYFLGQGRHVADDIPEQVEVIRREHPELVVRVTPHLGEAAGLIELLLGLAKMG